jgi:hypothetical protein
VFPEVEALCGQSGRRSRLRRVPLSFTHRVVLNRRLGGFARNEFPGATTYRTRELALWEHRKSSSDLARRLSAKPIKTEVMAPEAGIPVTG